MKFLFTFDGKKLYIRHRSPTPSELETMVPVHLTSANKTTYPITPTPISRNRLVQIVRRRNLSSSELSTWCANMAFFPEPVILKTLAATSQLIPSVEAENRLVPRKHLVSRLLPFRHR